MSVIRLKKKTKKQQQLGFKPPLGKVSKTLISIFFHVLILVCEYGLVPDQFTVFIKLPSAVG